LRDGTLGYTLRELLALAIAPQIPSPLAPDLRPIRKIDLKLSPRSAVTGRDRR
jgi:hypothetical protein